MDARARVEVDADCEDRKDRVSNLSVLPYETSEALRTVTVAAQVIADEMTRIHGGNWRVEVDHVHRFVLVRLC